MFMNLTIRNTKLFTIQNITSMIHHVYLNSTAMLVTTTTKKGLR